jgi:predicted NUDIX family NTP pyrophosphohydrolase
VKVSAGVLMFRRRSALVEVLLVHPGGPFWARKDDGAWTLPKGEVEPGETPVAAARREFREETGFEVTGDLIPLTPLKQPSGKLIHAWAVSGDVDPAQVRSVMFTMEWPRGSGTVREYPEVDRANWFTLADARRKLLRGQLPFLDELERSLRD